ncbi:hypothetical protein LTR36_005418 [Oleoguttula mirabilis]|uniref:Cutinase n=1 Tax=Oleoguttula mirabilis TaxID=1507867 RepID=A0AAV9JF40_9PEZI|nr:hypothetical protein LTR36_005418 [Oleoguttula mirabilis]
MPFHPSAARLTAAVCVLLAASTTTVATTVHNNHNALHARASTTCYDGVFVIVARGSEETQGQSVLETIVSGVTAAIPNSGSNEVVYPALLSFWNSAPTGATNAQQQMQDYYEACPDGKMILMGYSQGSYVMTTALAGGNYSGEAWEPIASDIGANIAAVVLFGDMSRILGQGTIATGTNCAVACTATAPLALKSPYTTAMEVYSDRLEEWCDADDEVCCSTGTTVAAHLAYWSTNTTDTVVELFYRCVVDSFIRGLIHHLVLGPIDSIDRSIICSLDRGRLELVVQFFAIARASQGDLIDNRLLGNRHCYAGINIRQRVGFLIGQLFYE